MDNPFADYGSPVEGPRFMGRMEALAKIANRVIIPAEPGNTAIVGEPRIGKSSLAKVAIIGAREQLLAKKAMPVWVNVSTQSSALELLASMVEGTYREFDLQRWAAPAITLAYEHLRDCRSTDSWMDCRMFVEVFFSTVRRSGYRVVFVLDEFDSARTLFVDNAMVFQELRELAYNRDYGVTLVTTSRRRLSEIESQCKGVSSLTGIFHELYLRPFIDEERRIFMDYVTQHGLILDEPSEREFCFYCGGHPYLMSALAYSLFDQASQHPGTLDVRSAFAEVSMAFDQLYEHLIRLHREAGTYDKLIQAVCGPIKDLRSGDVELLLKYGLVVEKEGRCVAFSEHFQAHLEELARDIDYWPLWRDTEKALRSLVDDRMIQRLGSGWEDVLAQRKPSWGIKVLEEWKLKKERAVKQWGTQVDSEPLVTFSYPGELFDIMSLEWSAFTDVFGTDKGKWNTVSTHLAKIRNSYAHSHGNLPSEGDRQIAEGYCKEILRRIAEAESSRAT